MSIDFTSPTYAQHALSAEEHLDLFYLYLLDNAELAVDSDCAEADELWAMAESTEFSDLSWQSPERQRTVIVAAVGNTNAVFLVERTADGTFRSIDLQFPS